MKGKELQGLEKGGRGRMSTRGLGLTVTHRKKKPTKRYARRRGKPSGLG